MRADTPAPSRRRASKPPAKPRRPAARAGRDGLGAKAQQVLEAVRAADGWVTRGEIAPHLTGISADAVSAHLTTLIERGLIEAQGSKSQRKVRAVRSSAPRGALGAATEGMAGGTASKLVGGARAHAMAQVREAIVNHLAAVPSTEQQLVDRYARDGIDREDVAFICGDLLVSDQLTLDPDGTYRKVVA